MFDSLKKAKDYQVSFLEKKILVSLLAYSRDCNWKRSNRTIIKFHHIILYINQDIVPEMSNDVF